MAFSRDELIKSPDYWLGDYQVKLSEEMIKYLQKEGINQTQFAEKIGVSKSYISQVINGNFNYSIYKYIELALSIGKIPMVEFKDIQGIANEVNTEYYYRNVIEPTNNQFNNYLKERHGKPAYV